jgi:hypothetical protein
MRKNNVESCGVSYLYWLALFICVKNHLASLIKYSDVLQSALVWNIPLGKITINCRRLRRKQISIRANNNKGSVYALQQSNVSRECLRSFLSNEKKRAL